MPYVEGRGSVSVGSIIIFDDIESGVRRVAGGKSKVTKVVAIGEVDERELNENESVLFGSNLLDDKRLVGKVKANKAYIVERV